MIMKARPVFVSLQQAPWSRLAGRQSAGPVNEGFNLRVANLILEKAGAFPLKDPDFLSSVWRLTCGDCARIYERASSGAYLIEQP